jgi:hypothetical protein
VTLVIKIVQQIACNRCGFSKMIPVQDASEMDLTCPACEMGGDNIYNYKHEGPAPRTTW